MSLGKQIGAMLGKVELAFRSNKRSVALESSRGLFGGASSYFMPQRKAVREEPDLNPYIQFPVLTKEQMKQISNDKYKFEVGYSSFAFHSDRSSPLVHSLSDLTDPALLNSLLPRRRPHGSPSDTLSIKAGDDAMLVSPTVLAVADGVSGWEGKGENCSSGLWARSMLETLSRLMTEYKLNHTPHHLNKRDIDQVLDDSYLHTSHLMDVQNFRGSSTLIMGMLSGEYLKMISIGDSKMYIIRDGEIIKTNEEQLISSLCPQQIGTQTLNVLPSDIAWVDSIKLEVDDIIVVCSDGISDNLYEWEIVHYIDEYLSIKKDNLKAVANKLLLKAKEIGFDDYAYTPYNERVNSLPNKYGKNVSTGGKLDDMSICVARVASNKGFK
ncbi:uncharacterized protein PRCAT00006149001 [Priceomyces carsonii]|uniref:uncharacterized protein n=1 Tax=Priceomyces carsonii TaxID=28549 RepID=UPI002ED8B36A|nr:unnamed protein product [Priceomyces carsonii]